MNDKAFVDTNVFLYLYSADEKDKRQCAIAAIDKYNCCTSTQALNEFSNVCTRKWKLPTADIQKAIDEICSACSVTVVSVDVIGQALALHERYGYSYYDCLMLASALSAGCRYLLSEDMADTQVIEDKLTILNIFADSY